MIPGASQGCREAFTDCEPKKRKSRVQCFPPRGGSVCFFLYRDGARDPPSRERDMVRRADWLFSGESARQLITGGDCAVASRPYSHPQPASREGAVVVEQRTPRASTEDGLGARHRCTEAASAEHGGQDGRRWEPASREHGFGRPAVAQRSGGRSSREVVITDQDKIFDRKRSVHNPRDGSAPAMLSQRQQEQLAAINRTPRTTQESMPIPTEAGWQQDRQEQQAAVVTRERRASKELMNAERKERMSGLMITTEDYGYTERHHSPRQKHYNAMARVDAEQAKQFGLQDTPFGLHGFGERPGAQTARDRMDVRPSEAHYDPQHPGQPGTARASHDKREDDAGRCGAPPPHLGRLVSTVAAVAAVAAAGCPRAQETTHAHAHPPSRPPSRPPSHLTSASRALPPAAPLAHPRPGLSTGSSSVTGARRHARAAMAMARRDSRPSAGPRWRHGPPTTASRTRTARRVPTACQGVSGAPTGATLSSWTTASRTRTARRVPSACRGVSGAPRGAALSSC